MNTYPSLNKAIINLDSERNSILTENTQVLQINKDLINLNDNDTLQNLNGNCNNTQPEVTAKLTDPEMSFAHLNNVNSSFSNEQEGRVTAVVAQARYQRAAESQTKQRVEHSARSHPSNAVIKVLLDSGSGGDLWFHEKGMPMHFPYLTRQAPNSSHTSNGSFLNKGRSKVSLEFFEYSNIKEFLVTPDVVECDKNKMTKPVYDLILGCRTMKELGLFWIFKQKK